MRFASSLIRTPSKPNTALRTRSSSGSVHCVGMAEAPHSTPATEPAVAPLESVSRPPRTVRVMVGVKSPAPYSSPAVMTAALGTVWIQPRRPVSASSSVRVSDQGETPRQAARRETLEETGLDLELGALLAVDWVPGAARPPIAAYVYDGGVLTEDRFKAIQLQEEELVSWRLVPRDEIRAHLLGSLGHRVLAALDALEAGTGTVELENGQPPV